MKRRRCVTDEKLAFPLGGKRRAPPLCPGSGYKRTTARLYPVSSSRARICFASCALREGVSTRAVSMMTSSFSSTTSAEERRACGGGEITMREDLMGLRKWAASGRAGVSCVEAWIRRETHTGRARDATPAARTARRASFVSLATTPDLAAGAGDGSCGREAQETPLSLFWALPRPERAAGLAAQDSSMAGDAKRCVWRAVGSRFALASRADTVSAAREKQHGLTS